jgi:hypothetical protein
VILSTELMVALGIQALAVAAAWGDMRRAVWTNMKQQNERHVENQKILGEIWAEVRKTNGTVTRHDTELKALDREVERLRDDSKEG